MLTVDKVIEIKCGGETYVDIEELIHFQGQLKSIDEKHFKNLKESLKNDGLPLGFHAWLDPEGKKQLIDGHHRKLALTELRKEGFLVPKVPVSFVKASSKKDAAKAVLISNSKYARMSEESISDFMIDFSLTVEDLNFLDIPDIGLDYFSKEQEPTNVEKNIDNVEQYILTISFGNEEDLRNTFERLQAEGLQCKIIM